MIHQVLMLLFVFAVWGKPTPARPAGGEFGSSVQPILQQRCSPCHFPGGKMHQQLPFDRAQTIIHLGEKKLFTRIRDEKDRAVIRAFLKSGAPPPSAALTRRSPPRAAVPH